VTPCDAGEQRGIEAALELEIGGACHQHMVVALAHSIDSLPRARRSRPRGWALQAGGGDPVAQAAEPQALVSPAPRSQVRIVMWSDRRYGRA